MNSPITRSRTRRQARRLLAIALRAGLALALVSGAGLSHADGDHDHHHMPMGSALGVEGPVVEGRQLCTYRPLMDRTLQCGTEKQINPGPPLRGKQLMFEANSFTGKVPTSSQQQAADAMVAACEASATRHGWYDFDKAVAAGYELLHGDSIHYVNPKFIFDDGFLDCDRPEYLMFYDSPSGKLLVGYMFITQKPLDEGPQIGGALTRWHYHYWATPRCLRDGLMIIGSLRLGECEEGSPSFRSPEMLHVWLIDHPAGRFSPMMHLDDATLQGLLSEKSAPDAHH